MIDAALATRLFAALSRLRLQVDAKDPKVASIMHDPTPLVKACFQHMEKQWMDAVFKSLGPLAIDGTDN